MTEPCGRPQVLAHTSWLVRVDLGHNGLKARSAPHPTRHVRAAHDHSPKELDFFGGTPTQAAPVQLSATVAAR